MVKDLTKRRIKMSNSPLINGVCYSPNHSGRRNQKITKIAIHHTAGVINGWPLARLFVPRSRQASANYNLGSDGVIILGVDEANRAWTTSSGWCDNRAVTIEVGNSTGAPGWKVSDKVLDRLIDLVYDICKRNGIYPCTYTGNSKGTLQMHRWYAQTSCPGPYLATKFSYIAKTVTARLDHDRNKGNAHKPTPKPNKLYKVTANALNVRSKPSTSSKITDVVHKGEVYTITETVGNWGKLKSGAGYISLNYAEQVGGASNLKVGAMVTIVGDNYVTGEKIPQWVKNKKHKIVQMDGSKALLGGKNGINSWVYLKDLRR